MLKRTALISIVAALILTANADPVRVVQAQGTKATQKRPGTVKPKATPTPAPEAPPYLSGEARVTIKGEQQPVIRLAMAASGVTVVEFPATDRFFAVHPPRNGDWVEVEKSPSMQSDHHLVLRAGKDLISSSGPAASISVQMRSGLVITLWVYPVKLINQQTYRCVISYNREEIVAARRRAGLAVDLGENEERETPAVIASAATGAKPPDVGLSPTPTPAAAANDREKTIPALNAASDDPDQTKPGQMGKRSMAVRNLLRSAASNPKKSFKKWSSPTNGLSVSAQMLDLDDQVMVALIAVRNVEEGQMIRLMPGHPELVIQTLDGKGRIIQLEQVRKLFTDSTTSNGVISAKATAYFAVAYKPPILSKQQRLSVTVGQRNAADDPAVAGLSARSK